MASPCLYFSYGLRDFQITFQDIHPLMSEDTKSPAIRILLPHDLSEFFLLKPGLFSNGRNLDPGGFRCDVRIQAGTGGCEQISRNLPTLLHIRVLLQKFLY